MKKIKQLLVLLAAIFAVTIVNAQDAEKEVKQEWYQKGSVYGVVYANYHTSASDLGKEKAFEVNRAYFGYKYKIDDHFSTNVKLDIGASEGLGRRFAFFKNAYLQYDYGNLKLNFGISDAFQFKVQEKFWGYRYIYKSFQDQNKFGASAELGVFAEYKFSDMISADASINNGDGYGAEQNAKTDNLKSTLGVTIKPIKPLTLRVYGDMLSSSDSSQVTLVGFVGLKFKPVSFGFEYVNQTNHDLVRDEDFSGISTFATYNATEKLGVFARYDMMRSAKVDDGTGAMAPWNSKDGDFIIGGLEYNIHKNVQLSLNYQHQVYEKEGKDGVDAIYFNIQASF